jgi:multidrug efflux system membrane fusion protein
MRYLLLLPVLLILASCQEQESQAPKAVRPAKVMTVGERSAMTREIPGTVRASQRVDLAFQVAGRMVEFPVKEGQVVAEGELLARLDDSDFQSVVKAAVAEADKNSANFDRAKELIVKDFVSQFDYDRIKATYDVSIANLEKAQKALNDTRLTAPFSGTIAKTRVENFEDIQAKQPILSLQDQGDLEIVVAISETLIARRDQRNQVLLVARFDALPEQTFDLHIKEFATEADPRTQSYEYVLGIKDKNLPNLLPGMTATVLAELLDTGSETESALVIPLTALVAGAEGESSVWAVAADNKVKRQVVVTGQMAGADQIEIARGIARGDVIVVAGTSALTEGMVVKPIADVSF